MPWRFMPDILVARMMRSKRSAMCIAPGMVLVVVLLLVLLLLPPLTLPPPDWWLLLVDWAVGSAGGHATWLCANVWGGTKEA